MPMIGAIAVEPTDRRVGNPVQGWWASPPLARFSSSAVTLATDLETVTLADGESVFATVQLANIEILETWNPGGDVTVLSLGPDRDHDYQGGGSGCLELILGVKSGGNIPIKARYTTAGGTATTTTTATMAGTIGTPEVWGASVKKWNDAGTWKVTVTLRKDGVDQATATSSLGSEPTVTFTTMTVGYGDTQGKGQSGEVDVGNAFVHTDSTSVGTGTAWTLTDIDNLLNAATTAANAKVRKPTAGDTKEHRYYTFNALVYYGASGQDFDTWPDTNCAVKYLIPNGDPDEREMQTSGGGTGSYTEVDDALGSASSTDYVTSTATASQKTEAFSFPAHGLSSKDVGALGLLTWCTEDAGAVGGALTKPVLVLESGGVEDTKEVYVANDGPAVRWWLVKPSFAAASTFTPNAVALVGCGVGIV